MSPQPGKQGVAFIEVRTEQGELVHRFTIVREPSHLIQPVIDALPIEHLARKVAEAMRR